MEDNKLEQLFRFLDMAPDDPFSLYSIGLEYYKRGDATQASHYFQQLREKHPQYLATFYQLGKVYEQLDQPEDAMEVYQSGIALAQKLKDLHSQGELQRALQQLRDEYDEEYN